MLLKRPLGCGGDPLAEPAIPKRRHTQYLVRGTSTKKGTFAFRCGAVLVFEERPSETPLEPPEHKRMLIRKRAGIIYTVAMSYIVT